MADGHFSIGDVLTELQGDFSDVTISKIRFLESQGLIAPERTPSGYRKFSPTDVERLRWILSQQRDHFLPLKVIKERLEELDNGQLTLDDLIDGRAAKAQAVEALFDRARNGDLASVGDATAPSDDSDTDLFLGASGVSLTRGELAMAAGLDERQVAELESFGLIEPSSTPGERPLFGDEALTIASAAARFMAYGIEPRHLRMYKAFAERELTLFEQIVAPARRQGNAEANRRADATRADMAALGRRLRNGLLQQAARQLDA